jgi:hypothetical protein
MVSKVQKTSHYNFYNLHDIVLHNHLNLDLPLHSLYISLLQIISWFNVLFALIQI